MKIKKILSFFALCLLASFTIKAVVERGSEADYIDVSATSIGIDSNQMKASKIPGITWNFELKNKDKIDFIITIQNGSKTILDNYKVSPSKGKEEKNHFYVRLSGLDLKKPTLLLIAYPPTTIAQTGIVIPGTGQTIFVTHEKKLLRPQSGTGIFSKETQSGLSLKNNIKRLDILNDIDNAYTKFWNLLSSEDLDREYAKYKEMKKKKLSALEKIEVENALAMINQIKRKKE